MHISPFIKSMLPLSQNMPLTFCQNFLSLTRLLENINNIIISR
jgi:hypothetical protein